MALSVRDCWVLSALPAIVTAGMVSSVLLADTSVNVPRDAPVPTHRRSRDKAQPSVVAQAPQPATPEAPKKDVVEILRGDRFEERKFDSFRAYYRFVPKGKWTVEYTARLNNAGEFLLPPTRVEALYSPEMFAEIPNAQVSVGP